MYLTIESTFYDRKLNLVYFRERALQTMVHDPLG